MHGKFLMQSGAGVRGRGHSDLRMVRDTRDTLSPGDVPSHSIRSAKANCKNQRVDGQTDTHIRTAGRSYAGS